MAIQSSLRESLLISRPVVEDEEEGFEGDEGHHEELEEDVIEGAVEVLGVIDDAPGADGQGEEGDGEGCEIGGTRGVPRWGFHHEEENVEKSEGHLQNAQDEPEEQQGGCENVILVDTLKEF